MQNVFTNKLTKNIQLLTAYEQAKIQGGSNSCGCSEEKRRKVRRPATPTPVVIDVVVIEPLAPVITNVL